MNTISEKDIQNEKMTGENQAVKPLQDPLEELKEIALHNLNRLGVVNADDIINAFRDTDSHGQHTTCLELKQEYWDPVTGFPIRSQSLQVTLTPEIKLEEAGGYTTVLLQYDNPDFEINQVWGTLTQYGEKSVHVNAESTEVPVLTLTVVPMSLGGQYGMIASNPIYWNLQPSTPIQKEYNQIRLLFTPDTVLFIRDASLNTEEVEKEVKASLAAERVREENFAKKEQKRQELEEAREAEVSEYLEKNRHLKHSFLTNTKDSPSN